MSKILFSSNQIIFFDSVQVENQKMLNASFVQTLNRFAFEETIDVVKKLKKELRSEYKKE